MPDSKPGSHAQKSIAALLVAAGQGIRFMSDRPKQYLPLGDAPVLRHAVLAFLNHPQIGHVQVVIGDDHRELYDQAVGDLGLPEPIIGGATRQQSVARGLESLADAADPDLVLIHDAARPLIGEETLNSLIDALDEQVGAIVAVPVADTLKRADVGDCITETVSRDQLWQAQTPQGFRFQDILKAHRDLTEGDFTDDASLAEALGLPVKLIEASSPNFKITRRNDLTMAQALMAGAADQTAPVMEARTGFGFDVHRLVPGDGVILCNVTIPSDMKLDGHSDADVALHALTDAILASISAGDIGEHFPPTDPKWKGADSVQFLDHALGLLLKRGGRLVHVDVTLMCEKPKIGPNRPALRERLAEIVGLDLDRVSVKATTTERLGFTGRGEGIACQAVASVEVPRTPSSGAA